MAKPKRYLRLKDLRERYQRSEMTIRRWVAAGDFPKPVYLGRFPAWDEEVVEAWERDRAAKQGAAA